MVLSQLGIHFLDPHGDDAEGKLMILHDLARMFYFLLLLFLLNSWKSNVFKHLGSKIDNFFLKYQVP